MPVALPRDYPAVMATTSSPLRSRLLTVLIGAVLLVLVGAPSAYACSCMGYDFEEAIENADLIAEITVEQELSEVDGDVTYFAVVNTVWKGEESRTIEFRTHEQTTACGLGRIPEGTTLRVWASGADGRYSSTWCALPMDGGADDEERLTELLGEPADLTDQQVPATGEPGGPPAASQSTGVVLAVGGTVLLAGVALVRLLGLAIALVVISARGRRG